MARVRFKHRLSFWLKYDKITTAKWFTPNMRWIDEKWIEPDVKIELTPDDYKNGNDRQMEWAKNFLK